LTRNLVAKLLVRYQELADGILMII